MIMSSYDLNFNAYTLSNTHVATSYPLQSTE